ncbi:MAG: hypothetical protein A2785_02160 [Candidatus Chisholmbacteria bacterium RIFCSPHIGHO2_01_FULL_49_18]|uniref:Uncharacterized protein n=2 Tax=Candidatus Chisholmiibacteriota TaxID=1817900 RepID=A0A1G1VNE1_9BACT|nr:MAG: hypothetical protein A2785_02160 [Candidatus Chisholmbacteria bacterium RIFCSPHIGHO2_01_FULL_49_18]OGY21524.1 MAG: hypothetical protein A3A65_05370 [Candidatus Chisholmbacteria bacterium RIFCSPLOWO2_01_FULL_49_14]
MLPLTQKEARSLKFTGALAAVVLIVLAILSPSIKELGQVITEEPAAVLRSVAYLLLTAIWVVAAELYERNSLEENSDRWLVCFGIPLIAFILVFWGYAVPQIANAFRFPWTTVSGANGFLILIITGLLYLPQLIRATWQERLTNSTS